jgi:lipoprotein-anchoring transpeptidase ErfK/SrfK
MNATGRKRVVAAGLVVSFALAGCGGGGDGGSADARSSSVSSTTTTTSAPEAKPARVPDYVTFVALAKRPQVDVFADARGSGRPVHQLANPTESGSPLVFMVDGPDRSGDLLPVFLPVRPNGSKGWVRRSDVTVQSTDYRVRIELATHRLTVTRAAKVVLETPIGVGQTDTPTPGGVYYLKELLQPPDPAGAYGPFAYGLSGFSNNAELANFNGGDGIIGIHGTNQPDKLGTDVSHGCIRVANAVITQMASYLPLGTPVQILP